jgi:hypothetical protein
MGCILALLSCFWGKADNPTSRHPMMSESFNLVSMEMLLAWPLLIGLLLFLDKRHGRLPLFLSYAYIAALGTQHWFGALAHAMPWNPFPDSTDTIAGFTYTTLGLACFVLGTVVMPRPRMLATNGSGLAYAVPIEMHMMGHHYAKLLFVAGALGWVADPTPLNGLPSVTSVISAAKQLLIAGICLKCWLAWHERDRKRLFKWLCAGLAFPVYSVLVTGFLGFGITFLMTILIFVGAFFRPRIPLVVGGSIALLVGIGFFASYLEHRETLRDAVWGNKSLDARIEAVQTMVTSMGPFDPYNQTHLQALDTRLNQNVLVGAAIAYVPAAKEFAAGKTIYFAVIALIPRAIWPDKPVTAGSMGMVSDYTGIRFAEGISVGMGQVLEFYVNFGTIGVVVGFFLFGMLVRFLDMRIADRLQAANWPQFALWFGAGSATLQPIGQLLEITSSMAGAALLGILLARLFALRQARLLGSLRAGR